MASGFFALLDDIATLMDDVAAMSKIATKKTAGILGDDLAVNAEKASGFVASREIPVLWAITKGSFLNKLIILPLAFILSAFAPWLVTLILLAGAVYLAYEGAEKIYEYFVPHDHPEDETIATDITEEEILSIEKDKIKSAIVIDFMLSVEIVIIALGTVLSQPLITQIIVVAIVAIIATVGVYGIVAMIVRMDDMGYRLIKMGGEGKSFSKSFGDFLVQALPKVIKSLAVIGTIALLLVAGGIVIHKIELFEHVFHGIPSILGELAVGLITGVAALIVVKLAKKVWSMFKKPSVQA